MPKQFWGVFLGLLFLLLSISGVSAQSAVPVQNNIVSPSPATEPPEFTPTPSPRPDLTQETESVVEPLRRILDDQDLGQVAANPIKYAIRRAVGAGVPINTIVLLLLLPGVAAIVAGARHLVGVRSFGILMPAALSVVFVATGPILGIGIFLTIVISSTIARFVLRKIKIRLQYLPRMSLILLFVVMGVMAVLFVAPIVGYVDIVSVSIFPVLFLVLLAEDFTRVQLGKSIQVALNLTTETLLLALISYLFLSTQSVQTFVLLHPEVYLLSIVILDVILGRYVGLRFVEFWRFRKLIRS